MVPVIKDEILEYIEKRKNKLKTSEILRILLDYIEESLNIGLNKKTILDDINENLGTDIKYDAFYSFLRRNGLLNIKRDSVRPTANKSGPLKSNNFNTGTKQDSAKNSGGFNPFKALEGLQT